MRYFLNTYQFYNW